jgi:hypothetical protein
MAIKAVHVWRLRTEGDETVVHTEDSWSGLVSRMFAKRLRPLLQEAIDFGLGYLKAEVEKRR